MNDIFITRLMNYSVIERGMDQFASSTKTKRAGVAAGSSSIGRLVSQAGRPTNKSTVKRIALPVQASASFPFLRSAPTLRPNRFTAMSGSVVNEKEPCQGDIVG